MRHSIFAALLLSCLWMTACRTVPDQAWQAVHQPGPVGTRSQLMAIEYDDAGRVFHPEQKTRLDEWLAGDPDPLVVFINGWHHNAHPEDPNYRDFHTFVGLVEAASDTPVNALYVGWRGDSIDTPITWEASDFLSIWNRKRASIAVGENGVKDLIGALRRSDRPVFVIGHSLGGSVLFRAVKDGLAQPADDNVEYFMLNPAVGEREFKDVHARLLALARDASAATGLSAAALTEREHRKLTVLQSLGDVPGGFVSRIAFLGPSLGFSRRRATHHAFICDKPEGCVTDPQCQVALDAGRFVVEARPSEGRSCEAMFRQPLWVVTGARSVSANHNDILNDVQSRALAELLAKRIRMALSRR